MKKVLTVLAVLTVCTAPALAQSFDPDNGTGNLLTFSPPTASQNEKVAAGRNGLHSFAMVPRAPAQTFRYPDRLWRPRSLVSR
jgi:hypothetical protein